LEAGAIGFVDFVFADTSAFYALADRDDRYHEEAVSIVSRINKSNIPVFTSNYIVAETHALILSRMGRHTARLWLNHFSFPMYQITEDDQGAAKTIIFAHSDKDYSLTDATSFCLMRRLGISQAFAFDAHFVQFGYKVLTS
jgi:predicted nucleic acid-binding protein